MPHATTRTVGFAPIPATYSRLPHDDELYVMRAFARHSAHCKLGCAHPYKTHLTGRTLCAKGMKRALDVAQYVFSKADHAFSVIDLEGNKRIQVEIPADCAAVRELLQSVERGLRLSQRQQQKPVVSYDEDYYVAPRRLPADYERAATYTSTRHQRNERPTSVYATSYATQPRYGSRRQRTYYSVGSSGVLPVPRKEDDYYYY